MMLPYNHIGLEVISKSVPDDMDADTTHLISYFIFAFFGIFKWKKMSKTLMPKTFFVEIYFYECLEQ